MSHQLDPYPEDCKAVPIGCQGQFSRLGVDTVGIDMGRVGHVYPWVGDGGEMIKRMSFLIGVGGCIKGGVEREGRATEEGLGWKFCWASEEQEDGRI